MSFDGRGWTLHRNRFDHVGIERTLHQETRALCVLGGGTLEHANEGRPDPAALLLRLHDAGKPLEELLGRIDDDQANAEVLTERALHPFALALAQQPVIDEDASELV